MKKSALTLEMTALRTAVAAHKAKILEAAETMDSAELFSCVPCGYIDLSIKHLYPAYEAARKAYETLCDDSGYFWACSRLRDLEGILGAGWTPQLPIMIGSYCPLLGGDIPEAHPIVREFCTGV